MTPSAELDRRVNSALDRYTAAKMARDSKAIDAAERELDEVWRLTGEEQRRLQTTPHG
jgi:hypothetical protein